MAKSILVVDTPNSCTECQLIRDKICPALADVDLSPCKTLGLRHHRCPLISINELAKGIYGMRLEEWMESLNS